MVKHAPRGRIKAPTDADQPMKPANPMKMVRVRCTATSKQKGTQCGAKAILGGTVCRHHGGASPQVQRKAMERLTAYQDRAIDRLFGLVEQEDYPSTAYSAVRDVLDRTMGRPSERVELTGAEGGPIELVSRLAAARKRLQAPE